MSSRSHLHAESWSHWRDFNTCVCVCVRERAAAAAKSLQSCPTPCNHRRQPTRLPRPWDSPGKNTCHFLLQGMKVKSESEVAQSCLTLSDPMDCSLPGSSIHGIFQARVLEWGAIALSGERERERETKATHLDQSPLCGVEGLFKCGELEVGKTSPAAERDTSWSSHSLW